MAKDLLTDTAECSATATRRQEGPRRWRCCSSDRRRLGVGLTPRPLVVVARSGSDSTARLASGGAALQRTRYSVFRSSRVAPPRAFNEPGGSSETSRSLRSRVETYFGHADALRFVRECEENAVRTLGMDFLILGIGSRLGRSGASTGSQSPPAKSLGREARRLLQDGIPAAGTSSCS